MLSVGIIGLPNVGKSTLFNALVAGSAAVSNYPFTTIESNVGVVAVTDPRLTELEKILQPEEAVPSFVQFIDIAGLVQGASHGEGLGNQFLANIRAVDAIVHVVRCFKDPDVVHLQGEVDPARDIDIIETELLLADLEVIDRAISKRANTWKTNPRLYSKEEEHFRLFREKVAAGIPLRTLQLSQDDLLELKGLGLLSGKPVLYAANLSEDDWMGADDAAVKRICQSRIASNPKIVKLSARIEWELQQLDSNERAEFLKEMGIKQSGLERLTRAAFELLNLVTFYTAANNKLRAWEVREGTHAQQAAGKIHTDMERGFVRAQVARFDDLKQFGSFQALHRHGLIHTEGRDYPVRDGDVIEFVFTP